jgi:hypothetical protein
MHGETPVRHARSTRRLVTLDIIAHGAALICCAIGGIVLGSVVLMAAASHHLASIGFRLHGKERVDDKIRSRPDEAMFSAVQLVLWTCCLLFAMSAAALGAHAVFHSDSLDAMAMASFVAPGTVAAATTAALAYWPACATHRSGKADALLSAAPTAFALVFSFSVLGADAGRLDGLAGLAIVLMLCGRTVIYLKRSFE